MFLECFNFCKVQSHAIKVSFYLTIWIFFLDCWSNQIYIRLVQEQIQLYTDMEHIWMNISTYM